MRRLFGLLLALGPTALYAFLFLRPPVVKEPFWIIASAYALPPLIALGLWFAARNAPPDGMLSEFRITAKAASWTSLVLMLAAMVFLPKFAILAKISHMGYMGDLIALRRRVAEFQAQKGRYPDRLEETGPIPSLELWTVDERENDHYHPPSRTVLLSAGADAELLQKDPGTWAYEPGSGRVFIACTGLDAKLRRPLSEH
ncbi:MAG: hypothetical protein WCU88_04995 [Elusimicrobiota bacterium]